ncbi:MAG: hypothetical protein NPINA01_02660 [Nitrospinaceae bacterium]|nr:MAG: hypothetical protein NPINA01_02660 [Nitrospinaceae bacterium]
MKTKIHILIIISIFLLSPSGAWTQGLPNAEPEIETRVDWDLANDGLLYITYDTDNDGRVDFCSWRIVTTSYFSKELLDEVMKNNADHLVFTVNYTESFYYYIAVKEPTLYAVDVDQDGSWDLIYKDPLEDGVNGNESLHYRDYKRKSPFPNS